MNQASGLVERLDFTLPDFTRLSWVSEPAREVWGLGWGVSPAPGPMWSGSPSAPGSAVAA